MKIHLGCGDKYWPGFVNIDFTNADIECDIKSIPLDDNVADEIHLIHVFEHLHRMEAENAIKEWMRVLKPGGKLVMEMPSLDKVINHLHDGVRDLTYTLFALYGDVRLGRPEMLHQWCWSERELNDVLSAAGMIDIEFTDPFFHIQSRDLRVTAIKPVSDTILNTETATV